MPAPAALLALGAFALPTAAQSLQAIPPTWSSALLDGREPADIQQRWEQEFASPFMATVQSGGERREIAISDCTQWRAWKSAVTGAVPASDYAPLRGQGAECDALLWIQAAGTARHSALPADLNRLTAARFYPATLWIGISQEGAQRLARPGLSLKAATGLGAWRPVANSLVIENTDQTVRLTWLARGDFDHDGWEDALYRWQAWQKGGTWSDVRLVLLTRRNPSAALVEMPASAPPSR